jgi:farnesyl-diphosphate farnesyltransferase
MASTWDGSLSQEELMLKDECILINNDDIEVGHIDKKTAHVFSNNDPRGMLHRAFSVFLFNDEGKLLLQQRAGSKITFPNVWTNTCCSHPLHGFTPSEIDSAEDVKSGKVNGVINAAIRKLDHELGITSEQVDSSKFKYLTRLHYWAADVVTHGTSSPWGEHEIDYILFIKTPVTLKLNSEEVSDTKYVSLEELQAMMKPDSGLLWSPWFRIIAEKFLVHWWADLNKTLTTNSFVDYNTIHRFDPTEEHMGGAGNAGKLLGDSSKINYSSKETVLKIIAKDSSNADKNKKQGAYGKVKTHSHSKIYQILRLDEVFSVIYFKFTGMPNKVNIEDENIKFCDDMLGKVSRSFAMVIRQLPKDLCIDILIFYLVLRALDTVEDDMEAFKGKEHIKCDHLNNFYKTSLVTDGWNMDGVGEADEKVLLQNFHKVIIVFKSLSPSSQEIIADITKRMGQGMASYVSKDLGQGTVTLDDYYLYCHFVAGLVGEGLSRLFTSSGNENSQVAEVSKTLSNTMGLFLQKTNIIRDYLEDYVDGRAFWPQEVWKLYTNTNDLGEFAKKENINNAICCLNHLVTDALECIPECVEYMELLKTEEVFRFCAIPQVMAIATLNDLYNNPNVFTGVVKIRKGLAVKLMLDTKTPGGLHKWFNLMVKDILSRIPSKDPNAEKTKAICNKIIKITDKRAKKAIISSYAQTITSIAPIGMVLSAFYLSSLKSSSKNNSILSHLPQLRIMKDFVAAGVFSVSTMFVFGYKILSRGNNDILHRADP